jgi:hypothetical protein
VHLGENFFGEGLSDSGRWSGRNERVRNYWVHTGRRRHQCQPS